MTSVHTNGFITHVLVFLLHQKVYYYFSICFWSIFTFLFTCRKMVLPYLHSKYVKTKEEVEPCTYFMSCIFCFFEKQPYWLYFPKAIVQLRCTVFYSPYLFSRFPQSQLMGKFIKITKLQNSWKLMLIARLVSLLF